MKLQIKFYRTARGDEPVREYLAGLTDKEAAGLMACVERLMDQGFLEMPHGRKMAGYKGLYEIRHGRHRILYCIKGYTAFLLHAFPKKSQQTPQRNIETTLERIKQLGGKP